MRVLLILLALLPGLALADAVGGPATDGGIQTASPQNVPATLNTLQPASADGQNLTAQSGTSSLQGSVPTAAAKLQIQADGRPRALTPAAQPSQPIIMGLTLLAAVLAAASALLWHSVWSRPTS